MRGERVCQGQRRPSAASVTLPGSGTQVPARTALREWGEAGRPHSEGPVQGRAASATPHVEADQPRAARCSPRPAAPGCHVGGNVDDRHEGLRVAARRHRVLHRDGKPGARVRGANRRAVPGPVPARHRIVQPRRTGRAQSARRQRRRCGKGVAGAQRRRRRVGRTRCTRHRLQRRRPWDRLQRAEPARH